MNFIAVKDLKTSRLLWKRLQKEQTVLLTSNGKPMAVMLNVNRDENPESVLKAVREARSRMALQQIWKSARDRGVNRLSLEKINMVIAKTRKARKTRS
jgi:antitoxin (DNA-binding transcriptional repressor) of toxin-antitoxin stability system